MATVATARASRPRRRSGASRAPIQLRAAAGRPACATEFVGHGRLVRRLAETSAGRLVVIVAPPGYGKSALLAAWAARDEREFVWRAPEDQKPAKCASGASTVTVLDDAHLASPERLGTVVEEALPAVAAGSTLALASRIEPSLPLARLRASQALIEIRADDLTMTPTHAPTLLRRAGVEPDVRLVRTLVQLTEGWPAALYLAGLAVRERNCGMSDIGHVRGDDHVLADYLRDEVLAGLTARLLDFALRTSILDELSAELCDAVLECRGSGVALRELQHASPLLRAVDPAHERYRWHGLVRDVLQAELRRAVPATVPALHRRASSWYRGRGEAGRAIDHAVRARDAALSGELLSASVVDYIGQGRNDLVQSWLAAFGREDIARHGPLALAAAYSAVAAGDVAEARHCAIALTAVVEREAETAGAALLEAGLAGLEAMIAADGVDGMARASARACMLTSRGSPWRPLHLFVHGVALHLNGDPRAGERVLEEAAWLGGVRAPGVTSLCLAQAALIAIERRDWEYAADLTDRARQVIAEHGLTHDPLCGLAFAAAAAARAHDGRTDEAKQDLRRALELLGALGDLMPWYGAESRILLAHASLGLADVVRARTLLAEASRLARRMRGAAIFQPWFDEAWARMDALAEAPLTGLSSLTIAELRILRFLPSHRSFKEIATQLGVSANTVKTQARAVYRKLGVASRSEAVRRAADAGLLGQ